MAGRLGAFSIFFACVVAAWCSQRAVGEVTVERKPPVVERRTFDPNHRPFEMPPLVPGEAALTQSLFDCAAEVDYKAVEHKGDDTGCETTVRVLGLHVTLSLKIIVWLPESAPARLIVHEEGHRQIDERIYKSTDEAANRIAGKIDGSPFTASAGDCSAAEQHAVQLAADRFCREYLAEIGALTQRVNDVYDKLTAHGTRAEPSQEDAIRQAFACEEAGHPAEPTGRSASKQ